MAYSINKVTILGNLGADPETRTFQNGGKVCSFRVATSERWKDRQTGEQRERSEWHNVEILNAPLVDLCERMLRKGSKVYVEGQLETRKWQDQNGNDRYTTAIVLRPYNGEIVFLDGKRDDDEPGTYGSEPAGRGPDMSDEIPFNREWR